MHVGSMALHAWPQRAVVSGLQAQASGFLGVEMSYCMLIQYIPDFYLYVVLGAMVHGTWYFALVFS